jgi:hypothetical protein
MTRLGFTCRGLPQAAATTGVLDPVRRASEMLGAPPAA